jgi:hypothetical protein
MLGRISPMLQPFLERNLRIVRLNLFAKGIEKFVYAQAVRFGQRLIRNSFWDHGSSLRCKLLRNIRKLA